MVTDKMMQKHFMKKKLTELKKTPGSDMLLFSCWDKLGMNPKKEKKLTHSLTFSQRCVGKKCMDVCAITD